MAVQTLYVMLVLLTTARCNFTARRMSDLDYEYEKISSDTIDTNATEYENVEVKPEKTELKAAKSSCKNDNLSDIEERVSHTKINSVYLNNIYTGMTSLMEISGKIEVNGVSLYDLVNSECGGAKLCPSLSLNWSSDNTITIGFLGAYGWSQTILGALPLAVAAVNREPSLLPGLQLRFVAADIGRSRPLMPMDKDSMSLRVMTQMRDLGVVAFFGPDGTCHTEAKLAAAWNLPLISHNKCQDLTSLLNSTQDGKLLLKQRLNPLGDQLRRTLTREIATEIVKYDPKAPITNNIYVHWIRQIERVFPAENSSIYYTKGPQVFGRAHGRLFDAVTNLKAKYRRNKIYQPRARRSLEKKLPSTIAVVQHATTHKKRAALVIEDSDTSSENEAELESKNTEIEECFEWLRSSVDNYALCDEKWAITRKLRQQSVLSEDACPYLQEFPCLQQSWGYSLKCAGARSSKRDAGAGLGSTFARTLPPAFKISKSVIALLKAFKWDKFAIVSGDALSAAAQQKDAIKELAKQNGMTVTAEHHFPDYIPLNISNMEKIVDQTFDKTRIYVFLGEHIALVDFVKVLQRRGLLQTGDYAVVAVDDEIYDPSSAAIVHADHLGQNSSSDIMAFRAVLKLTPSFPTNPYYTELCQMIREHSAEPPFCVPNYHKLFEDASVPIEAAHLYDAVILWARAATAAMRAGLPPTDGATIMKLLRPTTYRSVQGFDVYMDSAGDAEGNFTVIGLVEAATAPCGWRAQPVATFRYANSSDMLPELVGSHNIVWLNGKPPAAEPSCGFDGVKCSLPHDPGVLSAIAAVAAAAVLAFALLFRHYRYEQKLASVLWRIEAKDLTFILACNDADKTIIPQDTEARRAHTTIALYRGNIVAVKRLQKKSIDVTRAIKKELKQIRELRHENINAFVGVCVEAGSTCIVSMYCSRGSLTRVLADRDLHLDDMFVASLVADLLRGLTYLHDSALVSHGNLTSSNCLVDSRWVLQIADYGLHNLKYGCTDAEDALRMERRMLWRAPELLRDPNAPPRGSQKGDVYSFGIILYEILGRNGPWGDTNLTNAEIIGRVRQPIGGVLFRPPMSGLAARPSVLAVLNACWSERPDRRPDLRLVRLRLKDMHAGMKTNIFDNMLAMMEKYACNLEALVAARTEQLLQEKRRTDDLLHRMLPRTVAEALKRGERVQAESYECVTIYFSDIVGFTKLAATNTPMQVVEILNDLYTCCDAIISYYNVYKVETIGDAYMVVGGVPERCSRHAAEVASLALHVLDAVPKIRMRNMPATHLYIRIGIHSGQCAAGVVGVKMPRYCLFGDTVNTAARMESSGEPQRIHVSNDTYKLLRKHGGYHFKERGIVNIKGKGDMKTWWLVGEDHERRKNSLSRYQPGLDRLSETEDSEPWWNPQRSIQNIRDRARLSCGGSLGPGSALSSPGPPACACFVPQRDHHSAPVVSFCDD